MCIQVLCEKNAGVCSRLFLEAGAMEHMFDLDSSMSGPLSGESLILTHP